MKKTQRLSAAGVERVNPFGSDRAKGQQVEEMFDDIAPAYDLMNSLMSFGLHRSWRRALMERAAAAPHARVLDVATGTGDLALALAEIDGVSSVEGIDLSEGMLRVARHRLLASPKRLPINFSKADCLDLPFCDASFDLVTVAYGVRNFEHLDRGIAEMARVLRPGGKLLILELAEPQNPLVRFGYRLYSRLAIPVVGGIVSGKRSAYRYLPKSIAKCPQRRDMADLMEAAGLVDSSWRPMTLGTVCLYSATKP